MTPPGGDSTKLATLLTDLLGTVEPAAVRPECDHEGIEPLVDLLLYSFLLWESTPSFAHKAHAALLASIIDSNELRVSMPDEIEAWIGIKDHFSLERAERLRAALNTIYHREHTVTLQSLDSVSKREVREYLDTLEGMTPFVAARVTLLGFHGHAIPVDQRLCSLLTQTEVLKPGISPEDAERWLERQIRASDAKQISLVFDAWCDDPKACLSRPRAEKKPKARATKRNSDDSTPSRSQVGCSKKDP